MIAEPAHLEQMLGRLKLTAIRDQLDSLLDEAARADLSARETLILLCEREIARKDHRRIEMGLKLFSTFTEAGLDEPQLRFAAPIGGGVDWPGYAYLAGTFRSLLPFLERAGVVETGAVDVDDVARRLRDEVVSHNGVQILPALIGAWARTR